MNDSQQAVLDFLSRPESYPAAVPEVQRIDTHISTVFLAGERAYKLKRARRLAYLDFSTLAQRQTACAAEVAINRRTAPELYLNVGAVRRTESGDLLLDTEGRGTGEVLEWLVVMRRFSQDDLFDVLARRGALDETRMIDVADRVAQFHAEAEPRPDHGGRDGIAGILASNARELADAGRDLLDPGDVARLEALCGQALRRLGDLLDERREAGRVRHCHGDLHLRNICLFEGRPTLFDAIEFSEEIACIDVFYDLAFLLMDLEERGLRSLANAVLNRYLSITEDYAGLATLPLFLALRATIRCHVNARAARLAEGEAARDLGREAEAYLAHALAFLEPAPAQAIAVGGLSGTGKSTLGRGLAPALGPAPGAVQLRSDLIRKRLAGVDPLTRLPQDAYGGAMTRRVYRTLCRQAECVLAAGHAVVADAVFGRPRQRADIEAVARRAGVRFSGLWLEASAEICADRIARRSADPSDATVAVLQQQLRFDPGELTWQRVPADHGPDETLAAVRSALSLAAANGT